MTDSAGFVFFRAELTTLLCYGILLIGGDIMFSTIENEDQRNELEIFYKENLNCLLNVAYINLQNNCDAEDAVQEAFQRIIRKPESFFNVVPEKRTAFMVAVVRHVSTDIFNKKNNRPLEELDEEEAYDDDQLSFEDKVIEKVSREGLKRFIRSLPPLQRDVLTLRYLMGFSTAETAERLNVSESAVKKRLRLAKDNIRDYIRNKEELYE